MSTVQDTPAAVAVVADSCVSILVFSVESRVLFALCCTGKLPDALGELRRMKVLSLHGNELEGEGRPRM